MQTSVIAFGHTEDDDSYGATSRALHPYRPSRHWPGTGGSCRRRLAHSCLTIALFHGTPDACGPACFVTIDIYFSVSRTSLDGPNSDRDSTSRRYGPRQQLSMSEAFNPDTTSASLFGRHVLWRCTQN